MDVGVHGLPGEERHDALLELGHRLLVAEDERVGLRRRRHPVLDGRDLDPDHLARRRLRAFDRKPGRLLLADPLELLVHRRFGYRRDAPRHAESADALQRDVGVHLDQQVELDGAAVFELQVLDGRVGDGLERFGGAGGLPALADHFLEHGLPDLIAEPLPDHAGRRLARAEPGQPRPAAEVLQRAIFCLADPLDGHGDAEGLGGDVFAGLLDYDICHGRKLSWCAGLVQGWPN